MRACLLAFLLALPLVAQHGRYEKESSHPLIGNPVAIADGAKLYTRSCAGCHGADGSGGRGPNLVRRPMWHPLSDERIFEVVRKGLPGADMPPTDLTDDETWRLVAFLHALIGPAVENPGPGDVKAGAEVFWSKKNGCSNCHSIHGQGGRTGPDLTNIGGMRPLALIKESVLEPANKLFLLGREAVTVKLKDGRSISGVARNRDNYSLQVIDKAGKLHLLRMRDVAELEISESPMMPTDYGDRLSPKEIEDLLAFLSRQSLRDGAPEGE